MTNPVQQSPGEAPQLPSKPKGNEKQSELQSAADKLSQATGGSQQTVITTAAVAPSSTGLSLAPKLRTLLWLLRKLQRSSRT